MAYIEDGIQKGPTTFVELQQKIGKSETWVWRNGLTDWLRLDHILMQGSPAAAETVIISNSSKPLPIHEEDTSTGISPLAKELVILFCFLAVIVGGLLFYRPEYFSRYIPNIFEPLHSSPPVVPSIKGPPNFKVGLRHDQAWGRIIFIRLADEGPVVVTKILINDRDAKHCISPLASPLSNIFSGADPALRKLLPAADLSNAYGKAWQRGDEVIGAVMCRPDSVEIQTDHGTATFDIE